MKEKDPLKQFEKSDQELIHDIIDMQFLDTNKPIYIKKEVNDDDEYDLIQGEGS